MRKSELIKQDGTRREVKPKNGRDFKLKQLYNLLGCSCIDIIPLYDGRIMVIDDEGKFDSSNLKNELATALFQEGREENDDYIVGDILVTHDEMVN